MGAAFPVKSLNWAVIEVRNPTFDSCIGETMIYRMIFTREWAFKQLNWLAPLLLMGALGNSTSNNPASSDKCAFSNSRNSAKDVTEKNVQEFSHVLSNLCEPVIS